MKRTYFFIKNVMRINLCDVRPFYLNMELYYRRLGVIYLIFHFEEVTTLGCGYLNYCSLYLVLEVYKIDLTSGCSEQNHYLRGVSKSAEPKPNHRQDVTWL